MRLHQQDYNTQVGGVSETAAFQVEMNSMLFHSIIDGIYADKIESPIRELSTNAFDANRDVPFDVQLPTSENPIFRVRDYGPGLSHSDVMSIYTTMFASTKRDTNDAVGMIGLGSKSPFSYTTAFTTTSYQNRKARVYSCYLGEEGVPQIALLGTHDTDEDDGLEVSYPVNPRDCADFRAAAQRVYFAFDPKPNVLNETFGFFDSTILLEGDGWRVYNRTPFRSRTMARQGCVAYPLRLPDGEDFNANIVIDFPIGDLSVSTSREELGYDTPTLENIRRRWAQVKEEIQKHASEAVSGAQSFEEALEKRRSLPHFLISQITEWNGLILSDRFYPKGMNFSGSDRLGRNNLTLSYREPKFSDSIYYSNLPGYDIYAEFEDTTYGPSRMRRVLSEASEDDKILWIRINRADLPEWKKNYMGIEPIDLGKVEKMASVKKQKSDKIRMRCIGAQSTTYAQYAEVDITKDTLLVRQDGTTFEDLSDHKSLSAEIRLLVKAGVLSEDTMVYAVNNSNGKAVEKARPDFDSFKAQVAKLVRKKFSSRNIKLEKGNFRKQLNERWARKLREVGAPSHPVIDQFLSHYSAGSTDADALTQYELSVVSKYMPEVFSETTEVTHQERLAKLTERFPLLERLEHTRKDDLTYYLNLEINK